MKIIVIGAVAAGTSAAAKARRNNEDAEIVVYEKGEFISYSSCGMPYFLGNQVSDYKQLIPRDTNFFKSKYNIDIYTQHQVLKINPDKKTVTVKNLTNAQTFEDKYDKLIISTGSNAILPEIPGINSSNVFMLRNVADMLKISNFIDNSRSKNAVIIGTGFIGLEVCENLKRRGLSVALIEKMPQVSPTIDAELSIYIKEHLEQNGVVVYTNSNITQIDSASVRLSTDKKILADIIIVATGIKPNVELAQMAGIKLGITGAIKVNDSMQTSIEDIYACGDCVEQYSVIDGKPIYRPLGSTANKTGRIAGDNATGGVLKFKGISGTAIYRVFDMAVAQTGYSEAQAFENGYEAISCINIKPDKPEYLGGSELVIKAVADKKSGILLGAQILGKSGVDKRIDVFATAITYGAKAEDLQHLDLAYAPPFSTTKDPVIYTGMIFDNILNRDRQMLSAEQVDQLVNSDEKYNLIDARTPEQYNKQHIETAENIPHKRIREQAQNLDKDVMIVTYCNKGVTGNAAQNILINKGFKHVYNISGGHKSYVQWKKLKGE